MKNKDLKAKYDRMHAQGPDAWFDDGAEERAAILKMGQAWTGLKVLEIGCGEGQLAADMVIGTQGDLRGGASVVRAVDYSETAIGKAKAKWGESDFLRFHHGDYRKLENSKINDRLVMQGVLEHLDDPFKELKWMMDNLLVDGGDVITSSPGFINPRGFVWMTLDLVGAVMSKTDLHVLNPWQFEEFAATNHWPIEIWSCDNEWGFGAKMRNDLQERIPKALNDGALNVNDKKLGEFMEWLRRAGYMAPASGLSGATIVYKLKKMVPV
jgi:SAM-dependent methyltransferase